jgi:hypothetical protein
VDVIDDDRRCGPLDEGPRGERRELLGTQPEQHLGQEPGEARLEADLPRVAAGLLHEQVREVERGPACRRGTAGGGRTAGPAPRAERGPPRPPPRPTGAAGPS